MNETKSTKPFDLEDRTLVYAKDVIKFVRVCPKTLANVELSKQVIRSAGSVGANYIEARESLGQKDLAMRMRICRKEVKESRYWLQLFEGNDQVEDKRKALINESSELLKISTSIIE